MGFMTCFDSSCFLLALLISLSPSYIWVFGVTNIHSRHWLSQYVLTSAEEGALSQLRWWPLCLKLTVKHQVCDRLMEYKYEFTGTMKTIGVSPIRICAQLCSYSITMTIIHQSKDSTLTLCLSCAIPSRCNKCSEKALKRPLPTQLGTWHSKILRNHYYKVTI